MDNKDTPQTNHLFPEPNENAAKPTSPRPRLVSFADSVDENPLFPSKGIVQLTPKSVNYEKVLTILNRSSEDRSKDDIYAIMPWFRNKMKLFEGLSTDVMEDLLQHCHIMSAISNQIILKQGEKGNAFYMILQGQVSVLMKELLDDIDKFGQNFSDRSQLGHLVGILGEGKTFGEVALLSDENLRTASVVADDRTDLLVIPKDLYSRTVSTVINEEYEDKLKFVSENMLFRNWAAKWKKMLAVCMIQYKLNYEQTLVTQGEKADNMYFILSGEVKVIADPELHKEHFSQFMENCKGLLEDYEDETLATKYAALSKYLSSKSRRGKRLKSAPNKKAFSDKVTDHPDFKVNLSPSSQRKMQESSKLHAPKVNICYLESGQAFGDIEFLTGLDKYHATASCTMDTVVMAVHKVHFDRLFRKRNPGTIKTMTRQLGLIIPKRTSRSDLTQKVPLLKYISLKIQELNGERRMKKKLKDEDFSLPLVEFSDSSTYYSRAKSTRTNRTFPLMSHQSPRVLLRPTEPVVMPQLPQASNQLLNYVSQSCGPDKDTPPLNSGPSMIFSDGLVQSGATDEGQAKATNARDGIFVKLMQLSLPGVDRKHMNVSGEEYEYLVQLRKRMAKQMKDFYPYKSSEQILGNTVGMESTYTPRSRIMSKPVRTVNTSKSELPALPPSPKSARKTSKTPNPRAETSYKNNFSLPKF